MAAPHAQRARRGRTRSFFHPRISSLRAGVTNFIHVSALAADAFSLSEWARTTSDGEAAVRAEAPGATIVRPADVFGPEDRFLCWIARMNAVRAPLLRAPARYSSS